MQRSWFSKLLYSYLPVFFFVVCVLLVIFFIALSQVTRTAAEEVNQGSAEHVVSVVDETLRNIDQMVINELTTKGPISSYFMNENAGDPYASVKLPSLELQRFITRSPLIHSVYLVRWKDELLLSKETITVIEGFGDAEFINKYRNSADMRGWSGIRPYREFDHQPFTDVVTLIRTYPAISGGQGIMVVNVRASAVTSLVEAILHSDFIGYRLFDQHGHEISSASDAQIALMAPTVSVVSEYSEWRIETQLQRSAFLVFSGSMLYILLFGGFTAICISLIYIMYVSRKHSRPIQSLSDRISGYMQQRTLPFIKGAGKDEFKFMESAIDKLIEQTDEFHRRHEETLSMKRKHLLMAMSEGDFSERDWGTIAEAFHWKENTVAAFMLTVEIDKYTDFCMAYGKRDQSLLKFVIDRVVAEISEERGMQSVGEWLSPNRWSALLQSHQPLSDDHAHTLANVLVEWMGENMDFTVTVGIGQVVGDITQVGLSFEQSNTSLQYKASLGSNRVIGYQEAVRESVLPSQIPDLRRLSRSYRSGEAAWEQELDAFLKDLSERSLSKEDLSYALTFLLHQLSREIGELSAEYREPWENDALPALQRIVSDYDTLEEARERIVTILHALQERYRATREERIHAELMQQVRHYINNNFANPDLSLNLLSDAFKVSPKYVSQLFKEEFGEKFVDYLAQVRIEKAKALLSHSPSAIQEIAQQVGYMHSFSFIRVFKKHVGLTPGDYRKKVVDENGASDELS